MKILLSFLMLVRHVYTKVFEFFVMLYLPVSKQEQEQLKKVLAGFQSTVVQVSDYAVRLAVLRGVYPWVSDPLRGLIDWEPSKKNLWVFFHQGSSRDCDDFAALAYHTLRGKGYDVKEWCVFIDRKFTQSHMIVTAMRDGSGYIFDNHSTFIVSEPLDKVFQDKYNCEKMFIKYR